MAGRPSTLPTTVKTLSGSCSEPIGSVYFPSASRFNPGTSDVRDGIVIQVVQPSRFLPFQTGVQSLAPRMAPVRRKTQTRRNLGAGIPGQIIAEPAGSKESERVCPGAVAPT